MAKGKVGDRILVVSEDSGDGVYTNGHKGTICLVEECFGGAHVHFDHLEKVGDGDYLYAEEYKIIQEGVPIQDGTIPWAVGQEVFCLLRGKGVVTSIQANQELWECGVTVLFEAHGYVRYRLDGKVSQGMNRCLFFSEPQIIAETMPPKKPFVPVLKKGDIVFAEYHDKVFKIVVEQEDEDYIVRSQWVNFTKKACTFYKLGDKVEFNV